MSFTPSPWHWKFFNSFFGKLFEEDKKMRGFDTYVIRDDNGSTITAINTRNRPDAILMVFAPLMKDALWQARAAIIAQDAKALVKARDDIGELLAHIDRVAKEVE